LDLFVEGIPPLLEFIGVFQLPCHGRNIGALVHYVNGYIYPVYVVAMPHDARIGSSPRGGLRTYSRAMGDPGRRLTPATTYPSETKSDHTR
jgi:hypothetical protein